MGSIAKELLAGGIAGVSSTLAVHPLDTIRTRVQTGFAPTSAETVARTVREEGFRAFYKGMAFPLSAQFVYKSTIFSASKLADTVIRVIASVPDAAPLPGWAHTLCGSFGGGVNALVVTPVELVRNRLMVQGGEGGGTVTSTAGGTRYRGPVHCIRHVVATEGVNTLWRGLSATLVRDMPGVAVWYGTFMAAQGMLHRRASRAAVARGDDPSLVSLPAYQRMFAGSLAGVSFWTVALPADAIKAVVQTDRTGALGGSFLRAGAQLLRDGGVRRLYRGYFVACSRGIPGAAITFTTYSYARELL